MSATGGANRPPRFLHWANARLTQGLERGRAPAFMRLLTVRGRVTGGPHATPVVPVIRDGDVWVVSPYGEVAWVRNVRSAGQLELRRGEERTSYEVREPDARQATAVLRAYLTMPTHWVVRRHFHVTKRSSDDAIAAEADQHPLFCAHAGLVRLSIVELLPMAATRTYCPIRAPATGRNRFFEQPDRSRPLALALPDEPSALGCNRRHRAVVAGHLRGNLDGRQHSAKPWAGGCQTRCWIGRTRRGPRNVLGLSIEAVIVKTLTEKPADATHWSTRGLAKSLGMSQPTVSRIWKAFGLKPWVEDTFKLSTDPLFIDKVRDVVALYMGPPERAVVICVDEKTAVQALDRTQPVLPLLQGTPERRTHDYVRHGTIALYAALKLTTGMVTHQLTARHRTVELKKFLDLIEKTVPANLKVHVVPDNSSTHKGRSSNGGCWATPASSSISRPLHHHG